MSHRYAPDFLLLGASVLLAGLIVHEALSPRARMRAPAASGTAASREAAAGGPSAPLAMPALASLRIFVERPLFWASRRPVAAGVAGAGAGFAFVLSGVIVSGAQRYAILLPDGGKPPLRVHVGQRAGGWRIARIRYDRIELARAGRLIVVRVGETSPHALASPAERLARSPPPASFTHLWHKDMRWLAR